MKPIDVTALPLGGVAQHEYFSEKGELLLSKGMVITDRHIQILRRRNIHEVFVQEEQDNEEIERIIGREFGALGELDITDHYRRPTAGPVPDDIPLIYTLPEELRGVRPGKDGLTQLLRTKPAIAIDKSIEISILADNVEGTALSTRMRQVEPGARSVEWISGVSRTYGTAVGEVKGLLTGCLAGNGATDGTAVRGLVEQFVRILLGDHNILLALSATWHVGDEYLYNHALNVCLLSMNIAAAAGYSERQVFEIGTAALLHDVGMFLVPSGIRHKRGTLTADERYEVEKHPILSLHLIEKIDHLPEAVRIVAYQTHERDNGTGYPRQRKGQHIHRYAKIVRLADMFAAISSPRTYRPALPPYRSMEVLLRMTREGAVSPPFVKSFLTYTSLFPVGSMVELNDHRIGRVVAANGVSYTKPVVRVVTDTAGNILDSSRITTVNLKQQPAFQVIRSLPCNHFPGMDPLAGF